MPARAKSESVASAPTNAARLVAWLATAAAWIVRACRWGAGHAGRGLGVLARGAWRQRAAVAAVLTRVAWWAALVAWWSVAAGLLGGEALDVERARWVFAGGALVCAVIVGVSGARRLRWLGGALGSLHGASAVVLWFVVHA